MKNRQKVVVMKKKQFYYVMLLIVISMTSAISCSDDEKSEDLKTQIEGKWFWDKVTRNGKEVKRNPSSEAGIGCEGQHGFILLVSDNTGSELFYDSTPTGCPEHLEQLTWDVKGKEVIIEKKIQNGAGETITTKSVLTYVSLSSDKENLILKLKEYFENGESKMLDDNHDGKFDEEIWYLVRTEPEN